MGSKLFFVLAFLALCLSVVPLGSAFFTVTTTNSDNLPLEMYPGQIVEYSFTLQNIEPESDGKSVNAELIAGSEIARLTDENLRYEIPFGEEVDVNLEITIPETAQIGSEYTITGLFKPEFPTKVEGNVQFRVNIGKSFPVVVVEEPKESPDAVRKKANSLWFLVVAVLVLSIVSVIVIMFLYLRKKRSTQALNI